MNRAKYRAWLISLLLVAVAFGIIYYVYAGSQEKTFKDGTLVWQTEDYVSEYLSA